MIGTKCTPELLAALAKTPHLRCMEVSESPDGRRIASYTRYYTDEGGCKTTFFDDGDEELASMRVDCDVDGTRFGSVLGCDVEKVTVSSHPDGLLVSFVIDLWPEEGSGYRSVVLSASGSVEFSSEVGVVSVVEERHTGINTITSFSESCTPDDPWLVIVEPVEHE